MVREERNIIGYMVGLTSEFAKHYGIFRGRPTPT